MFSPRSGQIGAGIVVTYNSIPVDGLERIGEGDSNAELLQKMFEKNSENDFWTLAQA